MRTVQLLLSLIVFTCILQGGEPDAFTGKALSIEKAMVEQDAKTLLTFFDFDTLLQRMRGNTKGDERFFTGFTKGIKSKSLTLCEKICETGAQHCQFLRLRDAGAEKKALFRVNSENAGMNYSEFLLQKQADGQIRIIDIYQHSAGQFYTESIRAVYLNALKEMNPGLFQKMFGDKKDPTVAVKIMGAMSQALLEGEHKKALQLYETLPPELKEMKFVMLQRIDLLIATEAPGLEKAAADFEAKYPNDGGMTLRLFNIHSQRKDWANALKALDALDRLVEGDPFLDTFRSSAYSEWKKHPEAIACAKKAVAALPENYDSHNALMNSYVGAKDYAKAAEAFKEFERRFGLNEEYVLNEPNYAEFRKSAEFKAWWEGRKK